MESAPQKSEAQDAEPLEGLPAIIDIDGAEVDTFGNVPVRAQQIALLLSFGWSNRDIETGFRLTKGTVASYRSRYLDGAGLTISRRTRDVALATLMRAQASRIVSGITPEKIAKAGLNELAKSATMLLQRAAALEGSDQAPDHAAQISRALSALSSNNNSDDTESTQTLEQ